MVTRKKIVASGHINCKIKTPLKIYTTLSFFLCLFFLFEKQKEILFWHECKGTLLVVAKFDLMLFANFIDVKFDSFVKGNKKCYWLSTYERERN